MDGETEADGRGNRSYLGSKKRKGEKESGEMEARGKQKGRRKRLRFRLKNLLFSGSKLFNRTLLPKLSSDFE